MVEEVLDIEIDFGLGIALYEQIAQQILELIAEGKLNPGDQLPTIRKLAVQLGVNFNTVARAYRSLDRGAIISTRQGRGTFVLERLRNQAAKNTEEESIIALTRHYLSKAAYLGFTPEEIKRCLEDIILDNKK